MSVPRTEIHINTVRTLTPDPDNAGVGMVDHIVVSPAVHPDLFS
ncbi:hypothetical protein ALTERO38_50627 [Alteromonas sp. 38]|nr:hypothetical protein ALTER154_80641 [Alteromonas sp. 154]VXB41324.1 hypothetical protein ALTERO38_50627 [Alteromonas sp. 38]